MALAHALSARRIVHIWREAYCRCNWTRFSLSVKLLMFVLTADLYFIYFYLVQFFHAQMRTYFSIFYLSRCI